MKQFYVALTLLLCSLSVFGQEEEPTQIQDTISIKRHFITRQLFYGGERIGLDNLRNLADGNQAALTAVKSARTLSTIMGISGTIGGILVGLPLAMKLGGEVPYWKTAYIGAGFLALDIALLDLRNKQIDRAVKRYNQRLLQQKSAAFHLRMQVMPNRVGITLGF